MIQFQWDEKKAADNLAKHQISFEEAEQAFYDPDALLRKDRIADGEQRWHLIGRALQQILLVVHTVIDEQDQSIRIISARKADRNERQIYQEGL